MWNRKKTFAINDEINENKINNCNIFKKFNKLIQTSLKLQFSS